MQTYTGVHVEILYERHGGQAVIREISPFAQTYLKAGADHLVADIHGFLSLLSQNGVNSVTAVPDRSATRNTLEEAGFRGEGIMRYDPSAPPPIPTLDMGRPGAFGPETKIQLEDGGEVPAGALHPGLRLADGGRLDEVMTARVRRICRLDGQIYGVLNFVQTPAGVTRITEMEGVEVLETEGTDLVWLVAQKSHVRSGGHLFQDMWGSQALRQARRISQAEVIAALNASDVS